MCLCNEDRYANCFPFDFTKTSPCQRRTRCQNGGQCIVDLPTSPRSITCVRAECDYGSKCQFTTTGFRISLDVILGYHIRPHVSIPRQSIVVKACIVLATLIALIGFLCGILSVLTFQSSSCRQAASGHYLFIMSIVLLLFTVIFMLKFWLRILLQTTRLTNHHILLINSLVGDFFIRFLQTISDWLSACVAIERIIVIAKGARFNKERSRKIARWMFLLLYSRLFWVFYMIQFIDHCSMITTNNVHGVSLAIRHRWKFSIQWSIWCILFYHFWSISSLPWWLLLI